MAQYEEITIDQGADIAVEIHLVNKDGSKKDLTNHTVSAKMKKNITVIVPILMHLLVIASPATDGMLTISLANTEQIH